MRSCLICDDHPMVADALATMVAARWPDTAITIAVDFPTAWAAAASGCPDLCLLDLDMPGGEPRGGVAGMLAAAPATRLIIVTGSNDDALLLALLRLGIAGFVPKSASPAVVQAAVELVIAGGRYLPPRLAEMRGKSLQDAPGHGLTPRQRDVAELLANGLSNKDIARRLGVSPATVKSHVAQVIALLGAGNRTDAAVKARALSIV